MSNKLAKQIVGSVLTYVAVGLSIVAQANTYWSIVAAYRSSFTEVQYGIYGICVAVNYDEYRTCDTYDWSPNTLFEWAAFSTRILLIITDLFAAPAFVTSFIAYCLSGSGKTNCLKVAGGFNITGGSLTVLASVAYIGLFLTDFFSSNYSDFQTYYVGYCYIFSWVSGILFIIGGSLQVSSSAPEMNTVHHNQAFVVTSQNQMVHVPVLPATNIYTQNPTNVYAQNPANVYTPNYGGGYNNMAMTTEEQEQPQEKMRANYP